MAPRSKIYENSDGTVSTSQSDWNKFISGEDTESQRWAIEYNNAQRQYQQQYQLQQDAFNFNKDLSNRQQALSEESYYNGVMNQARQMQALGINPSAFGGSISGQSMQGGNNVASGASPQATGRNTTIQNKTMLALQQLTYLLQLRKLQSDIKVADSEAYANKKNADTAEVNSQISGFNSLTQRLKTDSDIKFNEAEISYKSQLTSSVLQDTLMKEKQNSEYEKYIDSLSKVGLNSYLLKDLQNMNPALALGLGILNFFGMKDNTPTPLPPGGPSGIGETPSSEYAKETKALYANGFDSYKVEVRESEKAFNDEIEARVNAFNSLSRDEYSAYSSYVKNLDMNKLAILNTKISADFIKSLHGLSSSEIDARLKKLVYGD